MNITILERGKQRRGPNRGVTVRRRDDSDMKRKMGETVAMWRDNGNQEGDMILM